MATAIVMPQFGNSVESCILVQWLKEPGDSVNEGEAVCEIETDKSTMEVEAPCSGILVDTFWAADDDVPVKINIAAIGEAGEDVSSLRPAEAGDSSAPATEEAAPAAAETAAPSAAAPAPAAVAAGAASAENGVSPRARNLASQHGVDCAQLGGTGPSGRIIERDVQAAVDNGSARLSPAAQAGVADGLHAGEGSGPGGMVLSGDLLSRAPVAAQQAAAASTGTGTREIPVKGIRKVIADRMMQSLQGSAQLTMNASFRAKSVQAYRAKLKAQAEALGLPNISINDMICYAVSRVLPRHAGVNAHFLGDKIVEFDAVHLGVAVDTPKGLLVPVVKDAQFRSLSDFANTFKPLAKQCIEGGISPEFLSGGTFTITNLGALGIESFTPVLNVPEVAILGVGGLQMKAYPSKDVADGVVHEQAIGLSLTIDHRALDGAPAARFLQDLVQTLENFELSLAV